MKKKKKKKKKKKLDNNGNNIEKKLGEPPHPRQPRLSTADGERRGKKRRAALKRKKKRGACSTTRSRRKAHARPTVDGNQRPARIATKTKQKRERKKKNGAVSGKSRSYWSEVTSVETAVRKGPPVLSLVEHDVIDCDRRMTSKYHRFIMTSLVRNSSRHWSKMKSLRE